MSSFNVNMMYGPSTLGSLLLVNKDFACIKINLPRWDLKEMFEPAEN